MISQDSIKKHKLDPDSLKAIFTAKELSDGAKVVVDLIRERIKDGRTRNLTEYKTWAAVDAAFDTPLHQTTPTLIRSIMSECTKPDEVLAALKNWGLSPETMMTSKPGPADGTIQWELNVPMFMQVFVPLVRAYVTIRIAKIYNDRNLTPLFTYTPRVYTSKNRILGQIATEIVESISINYGYSAVMRDLIFNSLMYSVAIMFPVEAWEKVQNEDNEIEREGIRYVVPHVSRTFYDLTHPLRTINTSTGCAYAGYWTVVRYGDVAMNPAYYNTKNIPHGTNWLDPQSGYHNYFQEVYPCTMEFPKVQTSRKTDRESMVSRYNKNNIDNALFLTYIFMEFNPSHYGLSDLDRNIWFRFTVAADDTIIYAEVFTYRPLSMACYDMDSNRGLNASMALEVVPFQDIVGNVFTNYLLSVKRNLANIVFYDTDVVDADQLKSLNSKSNQQYSSLNFIGFSGTKLDRQQKSVNQLLTEVKFSYADTSGILTAVNTVISLLERLLVTSAQEIGAAASHQQSKKEVEIIENNTSNRVAFTSSFIDDGLHAWRCQLWEAVVTNMSGRDVIATIPSDLPDLEKNLKELGFEIDGRPEPETGRVAVKGKISSKHFIHLISRRPETQRQNDQGTAQAMFNAIDRLASNQQISQLIEPKSLLRLTEQAAKLAGADSDFKVTINEDSAMASQLQQVVQQIEQKILQEVDSEVSRPAADAVKQLQLQVNKLTQILENLVSKATSQPQLEQPPVEVLPPPAGFPVA